MKRGSNFVLITCIVIGTAILCSLGYWQVNRMIWKEALIERVNQRVASDALPLEDLAQSGFVKGDHEYQPATVSGTFDHDKEVYFFTSGKGGGSGWHVHTPVTLADGTILITNRGFVPYDRKEPGTRSEGQTEGPVSVTGLLRFPLSERPFGSLENNAEKKEFYWRNVPEMAAAMGLEADEVLPVILDLDDQPNAGGLPRGGVTILDFPNNHLQYAVTWFGLALTLLGVGGYFLYSRRRTDDG